MEPPFPLAGHNFRLFSDAIAEVPVGLWHILNVRKQSNSWFICSHLLIKTA